MSKMRFKRRAPPAAGLQDFFDGNVYGENDSTTEDENPNFNPVLVFRSKIENAPVKKGGGGPSADKSRGALSRMRFKFGSDREVEPARHIASAQQCVLTHPCSVGS